MRTSFPFAVDDSIVKFPTAFCWLPAKEFRLWLSEEFQNLPSKQIMIHCQIIAGEDATHGPKVPRVVRTAKYGSRLAFQEMALVAVKLYLSQTQALQETALQDHVGAMRAKATRDAKRLTAPAGPTA